MGSSWVFGSVEDGRGTGDSTIPVNASSDGVDGNDSEAVKALEVTIASL